MGFLEFSRGFESDADYLGVEYMYKAGYDPQAFTAFFEKIQTQEKQKPGTIAKAFDTHPPPPTGLARRSRRSIRCCRHATSIRKIHLEFQDVKARLAMLENRRKIQPLSSDRPVLRRASNPSIPSASPGSDTSSTNSDPDTPTLKRRPNPDSAPAADPSPTPTATPAPQP